MGVRKSSHAASLSVMVISGLRSGRNAAMFMSISGTSSMTTVTAPRSSCRNDRIGTRPSIRSICTEITAQSGAMKHTPMLASRNPTRVAVGWSP
jgi:hypothetical protein